jgi:hypothetical protein
VGRNASSSFSEIARNGNDCIGLINIACKVFPLFDLTRPTAMPLIASKCKVQFSWSSTGTKKVKEIRYADLNLL